EKQYCDRDYLSCQRQYSTDHVSTIHKQKTLDQTRFYSFPAGYIVRKALQNNLNSCQLAYSGQKIQTRVRNGARYPASIQYRNAATRAMGSDHLPTVAYCQLQWY